MTARCIVHKIEYNITLICDTDRFLYANKTFASCYVSRASTRVKLLVELFENEIGVWFLLRHHVYRLIIVTAVF